jgi:disulfide bond formation protein DsbB
MFPIETLNYWLALGTILIQIIAAGFLALFFLQKKYPDLRDIGIFLRKWGLWIGLILSIGASVMTLFYSEVLGIQPCGWCWVQRVFLYPQILLFALAIKKKDTRAADYSIAFSVAGGLAALYQHYLQMGGASVLPCPASSSEAVDCAVRFVFEFGYITFPMMALTLFVFLIVLMLFVRNRE